MTVNNTEFGFKKCEKLDFNCKIQEVPSNYFCLFDFTNNDQIFMSVNQDITTRYPLVSAFFELTYFRES